MADLPFKTRFIFLRTDTMREAGISSSTYFIEGQVLFLKTGQQKNAPSAWRFLLPPNRIGISFAMHCCYCNFAYA